MDVLVSDDERVRLVMGVRWVVRRKSKWADACTDQSATNQPATPELPSTVLSFLHLCLGHRRSSVTNLHQSGHEIATKNLRGLNGYQGFLFIRSTVRWRGT